MNDILIGVGFVIAFGFLLLGDAVVRLYRRVHRQQALIDALYEHLGISKRGIAE